MQVLCAKTYEQKVVAWNFAAGCPQHFAPLKVCVLEKPFTGLQGAAASICDAKSFTVCNDLKETWI